MNLNIYAVCLQAVDLLHKVAGDEMIRLDLAQHGRFRVAAVAGVGAAVGKAAAWLRIDR